MISQSIDVNLIPGGVLPRVNVSQYDKGSRTLNFNLYNGASPYTIPANSSVYVVGTKKDNTGFDYSATYSGSTVSLDVTDQMTVFPGEVVIEIRIIKDGDQIGTGNFILNVEPTALADDVEISETDIPIIQQLPELIAEAEGAADLAHAWATYGSSTEQPSATNNAKYWAEYAASAASAGLQPVVVQTLPTTNISTSKLYLVPSSDPQTGNLYDEYINTDGTTSGYELIGTTGIDLSAYLQKTGDAKDLTVTLTSADDSTVFNSGNLGGQSSYAWSAVTQIASGETIRSLFEKISTMFKNIRTIAKLIGTTDISTLGTGAAAGTITGALSRITSDLSGLAIKSGSYNRGKNITSYVTDGTLWDRIAGTNGFSKYEDIMPWDYIDLGKTITAPSSGGGSTTGTNIVRVAQRGGINPYQFGLTEDKPCLVLVPETHFGMSYMNSTNVTTGGYKGSAMRTTILPNINSQLETTNLAGHILTTTELLSNTVTASAWGKLGSASGASSNWEWVSGQKCVLMSEMEVYGGTVFSSSGFDTGNACMQLEAFKNSKDAAMPYPTYFWLKDVTSSAFFCEANGYTGGADYGHASTVYYVRPRFIIA